MRRIIRKNINNEEMINMNMMPFIDIIFSILIAFMIPNQSLFGSVDIELPPANAQIAILEKDPIKVIIGKDSNIVVNNKPVRNEELINIVNELSLKDKTIKIYVMADKRNNYGVVLNTVGRLNEFGFTNVVLISDLYNRL